MTDSISMQEIFDSQAIFSPKEVCLLKDFDELWDKYSGSSCDAFGITQDQETRTVGQIQKDGGGLKC